MSDLISALKKQVNIDQRNSVAATIVSTGTSTAQVRLTSGETRTAYLPDDVEVADGDLVRVTITGRTATVAGSSRLTAPGGAKTVIL